MGVRSEESMQMSDGSLRRIEERPRRMGPEDMLGGGL